MRMINLSRLKNKHARNAINQQNKPNLNSSILLPFLPFRHCKEFDVLNLSVHTNSNVQENITFFKLNTSTIPLHSTKKRSNF